MFNSEYNSLFVIDTNIIISALIKDGPNRKLIFNPDFMFITPDYTLKELEESKDIILKKSGVSEYLLDALIDTLFFKINVIGRIEYGHKIPLAKIQLDNVDIDDVAFLALALAKNLPIWSNDKGFLQQSLVKIYSTKEMLDLVNNLS